MNGPSSFPPPNLRFCTFVRRTRTGREDRLPLRRLTSARVGLRRVFCRSTTNSDALADARSEYENAYGRGKRPTCERTDYSRTSVIRTRGASHETRRPRTAALPSRAVLVHVTGRPSGRGGESSSRGERGGLRNAGASNLLDIKIPSYKQILYLLVREIASTLRGEAGAFDEGGNGKYDRCAARRVSKRRTAEPRRRDSLTVTTPRPYGSATAGTERPVRASRSPSRSPRHTESPPSTTTPTDGVADIGIASTADRPTDPASEPSSGRSGSTRTGRARGGDGGQRVHPSGRRSRRASPRTRAESTVQGRTENGTAATGARSDDRVDARSARRLSPRPTRNGVGSVQNERPPGARTCLTPARPRRGLSGRGARGAQSLVGLELTDGGRR